MKSRILTFGFVIAFMFVLLAAAPIRSMAQEGELKVIDEVIAQVNDDVITLSMLKRETKERIEALKQNKMTDQQAAAEVNNHQAELIATLINEQLLLQKGKELDLAAEVEAEVNHRMLDVAKEQGITSIEKLDQALKENGLDPVGIRATMRSEMMKQAVFQQEVDRKLYLGFSPVEVKKYYDAHPDKFRKPESVTLSEIFLNLTGKNEADVKARATELVAQIRAGANFGAVSAANSEREKDGVRTAPKDNGKVGTFEVPYLREDIAASIKNVQVGGITDPMRGVDGYSILRVDERTPAATTSTFSDEHVREAMTIERQAPQREAYMQELRNQAFIKVSDTYRDSVEPLIKVANSSAAKTSEKDSDKKKNSKKP